MGNWSELQPELLEIISRKQTNYVDYVRLRAVCKPWRSAISASSHHLLCQFPWLLLPYYRHNQDHRGFFNLSDNKTYRLELPEGRNSHCCGSSQGWLVMVEESLSVHLLNPITKSQIPLPPLASFPNFPTQMISRVPLNFLKIPIRNTFIGKAILSADPSLTSAFIVFVIHNNCQNLGFCKRGDEAWSVIEATNAPPYFEDIQYKEGKLYAINTRGRVSICQLSPPQVIQVTDPPMASPSIRNYKWYLVESCGEILSVIRHQRFVAFSSYKTVGFEVFKLDSCKSNWSKVKSLDNHILFLGSQCSLSLSITDCSGYRGNCVYFTDFLITRCSGLTWEACDCGVLDLYDGSILCLGIPTYQISCQHYPIIHRYPRECLNCDNVPVTVPAPIWVTISPSRRASTF